MKNSAVIFLWMLFAALVFTACSKENSNTQSEPENDTTKVEDLVETAFLNSSELTQAEAEQLLGDFENIVSTDPEKTFVCGFELNHGDIKALLDDPDLKNVDTLFAMLGYSQPGDSFDLVICIETPVNSGHYRFFDFTQPCPEQCPAYMDTPCSAPGLSDLSGNKGYWFGREGLTAFLDSASSESAKTYCMYKDGEWANGIYGIVCNPDCDAPSDEDPYFAPCGTDPECFQID